jgi:hypothetical protein
MNRIMSLYHIPNTTYNELSNEHKTIVKRELSYCFDEKQVERTLEYYGDELLINIYSRMMFENAIID